MGKYMLMPKLDMSMEEGQIIKWMCKVGDKINKGDIVVEVETGKVSLEVDNPTADGTVLALYCDEGDDVKVNTPIMYIGDEDEKAPSKEEALGISVKKEEKDITAPVENAQEVSRAVSKNDFDGKFMLMPKLDMSMEEGQIVKWMCKVGDETKKGDIVVEVETGKVSLEVDNPTADGFITALYAEEGENVNVNEPIMFIGNSKDSKAPSKEEAFIILGLTETSTEISKESESESDNIEMISSNDNKSQFDYDYAVIGAGPGGYVSAIRAAQLGAKVVIFEKEEIGGVCLNKGCVPTKSFVKNADVLREVKNADEMGIQIQSFTTDWKKVVERKDKVVAQLTGGVSGLLNKNKVEVVMAEAEIFGENIIKADGKEYNVGNICIAVGSDSINIPFDNDGSVEVYDSEGMLNVTKLPKDLAIVGGGVIGVEMAGIFAEYGVNVTIIEMLDSILTMADEEIIKELTTSLKKSGIKIITGIGASKIEKGNLILSDGGIIKADTVLMSVGRKPVEVKNNIGISTTEKGFIEVNDKLQTNVDNVYAIGDVTGKNMLAHTASRQGIVVAENIFGGESLDVNYDQIPSCVFTHPEVAWIGLTEKEVKKQNIPYKVGKMPFVGIGKALAINETKGFMKVITDERWDEIIGVHIIGPGASDIIAEAGIAMNLEATSKEIANTVFAHPTLSEIFMEASEAVHGKMIHS